MNNKTIRPLQIAYALIALTLALLTARPALAQHQLWIRQFGTSTGEWATALAPDGAGGVMVTGVTWGSLGGPSAGLKDVFLARYDGAGNQLWIRQFGTRTYDRGLALATDGAGGVIVGGATHGSLGGPNQGSWDVFLARYDHAGNQIWIRQFGARNDGHNLSLVPDGAGGVMVAGPTGASLGGPNAGSYDAFLARYDSAGNQLWIRQFGTSDNDYALALAPDGAGGVVVAGKTSGSLARPNPVGTSDAFLARYDGSGNQLWIRQFGTIGSHDQASALALDGAGGVMVAGWTMGSLGRPIMGPSDAFLARYDEAGNQIWIHQFGGSRADWATALAPDGAGGVIFAGVADVSPGVPNLHVYLTYLARFDGEGNLAWSRHLGTSAGAWAEALAPDGAGCVMVAGRTGGSLGGPNAGAEDVVLARYEIDSCYPDCDRSTGNGVLDIFDFLCFQNSFVAGDPYACDCDTSTGPGVCDISDFLCFQSAFLAGCP